MTLTAYERILDALDDRITRRKGSELQVEALCPAHDDRKASLNVTGIKGQALIHCFAGCSNDQVVAALHLRLADLFDQPSGAEYLYDDGRVVHRTPDKRFRQSGNTQGTATLYRLDRVKRAVADGTPVWVVEGEKDVHALEALGAVASTNPMGSASWKKVDASPLHGGTVIVVPDKDRAGRRWVRDVRDSLEGLCESLEYRAPKAGKDPADHVASGFGLDDFLSIELDADSDNPGEIVTLSSVQPERVSWLWPGRFPLGKLVVLDGDPSVGKSSLTLDIAARVSTGAVWPDGTPGSNPADVLLLSAEDGLADTIRPRLDAAGADVARVHALTEVPLRDEEDPEVLRRVPASLPRDIDLIEQIINHKKVRLVVIDVLMAFLSARVDSHRDQDVRGVLHRLSAMAERTGCCILVVQHLRKSHGGHAIYAGGGSIGIIGAARAAYLVARDPDDENRRILAATKINIATEPPSLAYRLIDALEHSCARVQWEDAPTDHTAASLLRAPEGEDERNERDEAADWLRDYLTDNGGQAASKDILKAARAAGHSPATLKRAKLAAGVAHRSMGFPRATVWELVSTVSSVSSPTPKHTDREPTGKREPTGDDQHKHHHQPDQTSQLAHTGGRELTEPQCARCGQRLLLADPGRTQCEACRLAQREGVAA